MKNSYINKFKYGFLGASVLLGTVACSEDHFDVKDPSSNGSGSTIWKSIQSNPDLSEVADVLSKTRVMKDDKDKKSTLTYDKWLDASDELAAWLPTNDNFDPQPYLNKLAEAERLKAIPDSLAAGLRLEYQVVKQFVNNHIALFNSGASLTQPKVRMLNSKNTAFNLAEGTFGGVKFNPALTTHNSNGVLYVLESEVPFRHNIYDYMSSSSRFSTVFGIITNPMYDKNVFSPDASLEGAMNEKGEMVYVDSVFINTNEILNRSNALIKSEDSIYVAFIPDNEAYKQTYKALEPLFEYGKSYNYDWQDGKFNKTGGNALKFNVDSLVAVSTQSTLLQSMFFNPSSFEGVDKTDSAALINHIMTADSLITTNGVVFYNKNKGGINPMFDGLTPVKASNGYVFVPSENRIDPAYSFMGRTEISPRFITAKLQNCKSENGEVINLTIENWQKDSVEGEVENDQYMFYEYDGNMSLKFKILGLPSGHYKISAQMLPNRINYYNANKDDEGNQKPEDPRFSATLTDDASKRFGKTVNNIHVPQDRVANVVLFDDVYVDKSYAKLPDGYESFAILEIKMSAKDHKDGGRPKGLSIAKIIIEPVRK